MNITHSMTKLFISILIISWSTAPLQTAGPVVHVYCAELYFTHCKPSYTQKERDAFIRGTLFPDIRYVASIPRTSTHHKNVSLATVKATHNPFTAGVLFHTYVDEQRERIAQAQGIYYRLTAIPERDKATFLKTLEDEHCYSLIAPQKLRKALLKFDREERAYPAKRIHRVMWHKILREYFNQPPLAFCKHKVESNSRLFSFSQKQAKDFYLLLERYASDKEIAHYIVHFKQEFEKRLTS